MRRLTTALCFLVAIGVSAGLAAAAEKAPKEVVDLANTTLAAYGKDPVLVEAVRAENAKGKSLDQIRTMDAKWQATPGVADFMRALMENPCAKRIKGIQGGKPYFAEIFVVDNQGANVCMTDKTSDYWQGDEAKFKNSYRDGQGAVFVDDVKFDDSTQTYISQVSVPVLDGGRAIGAITFGIDIDRLK